MKKTIPKICIALLMTSFLTIIFLSNFYKNPESKTANTTTSLSKNTPAQTHLIKRDTIDPKNITTTTLSKTEEQNPNISSKIQNSHLETYSKQAEEECRSMTFEVINFFPQELTKSLKNITFDFEQSTNRGNGTSDYMKVRCVGMQKDEFQAVVVHEIGHIIDGGYLTGKAKQKSSFKDLGVTVKADDPSLDYYNISWKDDSTWKEGIKTSDFCSKYGSTDPYEDFAECFTYFVLHNQKFKEKSKTSDILKAKYTFFETEIFRQNYFSSLENKEKESPIYIYDITKLAYVSPF